MLADPTRTSVIRPPSGWSVPDLRELLGSADLIYFLAKRDVAVRYKQTVIGALWAVIQPLMLAGVFSVFLGQLTDVPSEGSPYALFALTGMTMWLFFANSIARASESTVASAELISKVYFPRMAIPVSAIAVPVIDFVAAFAVLVIILTVAGEVPTARIVLVPGVFAVAVGIALGAGLWLSAVVVRFRDVSLTVPLVVQVMLFITPVIYPLSLVPASYRALLGLNPMVGVLETFRWAVLPDAAAPGSGLLLVSVGSAITLLISGLLYFNRAERSFADHI